MELRHLRYFLRIAELNNLSRAAKQVFVSQSTLSHGLRQLEEELGTPLFDRIGRRIRLTQAGSIFRDYAARALNEVERGITTLQELKGLEGGTLNFGVIPAFQASFVPNVVTSFRKRYPKVSITVQELRSSAMEDTLAAGGLDIGLGLQPASRDEVEAEYLFEERLLLLVARNHPLAKKQTLQIKSLATVPLALLTARFATRRLIDKAFGEADVRPNVMIQMESIEGLIAIARRGAIATIVPDRAAAIASGVHAVRLTNPEMIRKAALLWRKRAYRTRAASTFAQMLREEIVKTQGLSP